MELLAWLIVCALAIFRLSELLVIDDGPFDIFFNLRGWANKPPTGTWFRGTLADVLGCVHCTGLWLSIALGVVGAIFRTDPFYELIIFILGVAGLQSILANCLGRTAS